MKKFFAGMLMVAALAVPARAGVWTEDYAAALAQAKQDGKYILMYFTGSDWCGWCKRLKAEVFSKPSVVDYAKENLVCLPI